MNTLRTDPQRIASLRVAFLSEIGKRFAKLIREIRTLIIDDDALGLAGRGPFVFNFWRFLTDDQKAREFMKWMQAALDRGVLQVESDFSGSRPWTAKYVEAAYRKGAVRVYIDANKARLLQKPFFFRASQEEFLRFAFSSPAALGRIKLVSTRAFDQLKGITDEMSQNISRILADGLSQKVKPITLANQIGRVIRDVNNKRALRLVRTELSHAFTEGQLDSFEALGIDEITVMVEWINGSNPCPVCSGMSGVVLSIDEARGLIPVHPSCQCSYEPIIGQKLTKSEKAAGRRKLARFKAKRRLMFSR